MIINRSALLKAAPIVDMVDHKVQADPTSWGLTECGYDIRIKQGIHFLAPTLSMPAVVYILNDGVAVARTGGRFVLASSIEEFRMPNNLMGRILNKSSWARRGVDASLTTNIEPGWNGFLTIELTFNGEQDVHIPAGSGILQVIFEEILEPTTYVGRYQNQADKPVEAQLSLPL